MTPSDPLRRTVAWLAANAQFPGSRLEARAEILICLAAAASDDSVDGRRRYLVEPRDRAKDAALRSHIHRRSQAHYICDNKTKT